MGRYMGIKDLTEKILEDYNDIFADIVNVLVFKGKQRIKPETLVNTGVHSQYKNDKTGVLHEQERDVAKYWKNGKVRIALCGLENQTAVEPKMPLRVFGYEGASYRGQLEEKSAVPVITLVLYFGNEHWRAEKHLKDLLDIPEGMEEYVNDLKINVFEIAWLTDEQISMFKSDFRIVADFFVRKRKNKDYVPDNKTEIRHVDAVLKMLSAVTGDRRYENILSDGKGKVSNMCEVAERLEQMGIEKGRLEGEQMTVYSFVQDKTITPEQGAHKLNISVAELEKKMKEAGYTYPVF